MTAAVIPLALTARTNPVLLRFEPDPDAIRPRTWMIMNPFRDRTVERAATEHLQRMRRGDLSTIAILTQDNSHILAREKQYPVRSWRIADIDEHHSVTRITYWVRRGGGYNSEEQATFVVDRAVSPPRAVYFSAIY